MIMLPEEDNMNNHRGLQQEDHNRKIENAEEDSGSEEDDRVEALANIHNYRGTNSSSSFRRYDEMGSFLTRSERSIQHPDEIPSKDEEAKRKVHFRDGSSLFKVHFLDRVSETDARFYYMTDVDFTRVDRDIDVTTFRWENHLSGEIPFDHENNTIRGLEEMLSEDDSKYETRAIHRKSVFEEVNRQRLSGQRPLDTEGIRKATLSTSEKSGKLSN